MRLIPNTMQIKMANYQGNKTNSNNVALYFDYTFISYIETNVEGPRGYGVL